MKKLLVLLALVSTPAHALDKQLTQFVREVQSDCGSRVISAQRRTLVAGTHRMSCHASGQAVDLAGNPKCIRRHLMSWPHGASTDYYAVGHYHVSTCAREDGLRFVHRKTRLARR